MILKEIVYRGIIYHNINDIIISPSPRTLKVETYPHSKSSSLTEAVPTTAALCTWSIIALML